MGIKLIVAFRNIANGNKTGVPGLQISQSVLWLAAVKKECYERDKTLLKPHIRSYISSYIYFIFSGSAAQRGLWSPRSRGFLITHNDAPQLVGLLWTSDQLVAESST
jgi:hypothetical protein